MMLKLLESMDRGRYEPTVVTLIGGGPLDDRVSSLGIRFHRLGMRPGVPDPRVIWSLARLLRLERPDLVQTWTYHADLIGGLASKLAGGISVAWGIRHSVLVPESTKRMTRWTAHVCARLSGLIPERIICNSEASRSAHAGLGYELGRMVVIPNGFDLGVYRPDPAAGPALRRELGIPPDNPLVGLVARFHKDKDQANFLAAAGALGASCPDVHFVLCGENITWENAELVAWVERAGLRGRCHLLGRRHDLPRIQAALDIATSSSRTESFANAIGEAMASAVPCVVTDVGDSRLVVGETGRVVAPREPGALARAWDDLLGLSAVARAALGAAAREHVARHFSLPVVAGRYAEVYDQCVEHAVFPHRIAPAAPGRGRAGVRPGGSKLDEYIARR